MSAPKQDMQIWRFRLVTAALRARFLFVPGIHQLSVKH